MKNQVTHAQFGVGLIVSQDEKNVTVDFNGNVKTLIIKFAKLTNEDGSTFGVQFVAAEKKSKKLNKANFMSNDDFSKSKYATMSNDDFAAERKLDAMKSVGWAESRINIQ